MPFARLFLSLWTLVLGVTLITSSLAADEPPTVKVMSFNVRFGTAKDGDNQWEERKVFLVETIRAADPDLLGTQETMGFQRDYLAEYLPAYEHLGVGRDDGSQTGEMMALFYKRDRFEKLDGGHFWLSEAPATVGSKSWDSSLPRMATWVKLKDRKLPQARTILFVNTHYDQKGEQARQESSRLVRTQLAVLGKDCSIILTGDFNAGEGSKPYELLFAPQDAEPSPVVDSYRVVHPERAKDEGTFNGFKPDAVSGARIDWLGVSRDWKIEAATIDRTVRNGRTPSDHFPITALLRRQ